MRQHRPGLGLGTHVVTRILSSSWLKMTPKVRRLAARLRYARWRVRQLEMLLRIAQREAATRCEHQWVKELPSGMRDNGEFWYRCKKCGTTQ